VTKVNGFMKFTFLQIMCIIKFEIMIPNMSICVFVAIVQIHCCIATKLLTNKNSWSTFLQCICLKNLCILQKFSCVCWSFLVVDTSKSRKWKGFLSVLCQHFYGTQGFPFEIYDSKKLQVKFGFSLHLTLTANKDATLDYVATNILHMNTKNGKVTSITIQLPLNVQWEFCKWNAH
jgi:hypothetical protein